MKKYKIILSSGKEKIVNINDDFELKFILQFNKIKKYYEIKEEQEK